MKRFDYTDTAALRAALDWAFKWMGAFEEMGSLGGSVDFQVIGPDGRAYIILVEPLDSLGEVH